MSRSKLTVMALVVVLVAGVLCIALVVPGFAAAPPDPAGETIPYNGQLSDGSGQLATNGTYQVTFSLYRSQSDGAAVWTESQVVEVRGGLFSANLGSIAPLSADLKASADLWLEVAIKGPNDVSFTTLSPRQAMSAVIPSGSVGVQALTCPHSHFGDSWTGSTTAYYGLRVENTGTGDGIRALSASTTTSYAAIWAVNNASSGYGTGVYAGSTNGVGLNAVSSHGDGIDATTSDAAKSAVYAHSTNGLGVAARSANKFGITVGGGGDSTWSDLVGDLNLEGSRAEVFAPGDVLELYSNGYIALDLDNDNNATRQFEIWNGADTLIFKVDENGNMTATGTKSATVQTSDYGQRLMYAIESPEVWFEDVGSAQLVDGVATVQFDPVFAQTANLGPDYHVFVTANCAQPAVLFVSSKTATGFTVQGVTLGNAPSNCAFDYRVAAKRLGYESIRLAPVEQSANSRAAQ